MSQLHIILISIATLIPSRAEAGPKPEVAASVVPAVVTQQYVYTWMLKVPPKIDEVLETSSLVIRCPVRENGALVFQSVDSFLFSNGHHFPLRWAADANGLWLASFLIEMSVSDYVPNRCNVSRVPARFIIGTGTPPKLDPKQDEGFRFDDEGLYISSSATTPSATSLRRGFLAAYARDQKPDELMKLAAVGKSSKDGRPPFTFDFTPPATPTQDWTLYVQRFPRKTVDVVTFRADKAGQKIPAKVESIPVPFAEPFFAHRDSTGQIFFVTERTGRVYVAEPLDARKARKVKVVWDDADSPAVALVRDSRDGSAYVGISKKRKPGAGGDRLLHLSGKPTATVIDLKKVPAPRVNRSELAAVWFGRAVALRRPAKPAK